MSWCPGGEPLDTDIFDAMTELITHLMQRGEKLADRYQFPVSCMKALRQLDGTVSMKDLGQRLHCDPSFVTMIADALEGRGLARREPSPTDRRIKNLVLTPRGLEIKAALEQEMLRQMPWSRALDEEERKQFLDLVRKMNRTLAAELSSPVASATECAGEVTSAIDAATPVAP